MMYLPRPRRKFETMPVLIEREEIKDLRGERTVSSTPNIAIETRIGRTRLKFNLDQHHKNNMVKLIDIPFVQPLADWVWGEKDSPVCLSELPLLGVDCFSQLVTKAFGIVIILASMLNKIPIMRNMYNSQSAAGISRNSLYGESMVYANCALYGLLSGHPFTAL